MTSEAGDADVIAVTTAWLEKAVLGLELCPFAREPHAAGRIRYVVSQADTAEDLVQALLDELHFLTEADPAKVETTLLIHPHVFEDFLEYNDFLDVADAAVEDLGLDGEIQVASFHPRYQFSGTDADDMENYSNRSPYPMLHLLREASVERAVAMHPDIEQIPQNNIRTLRRLGRAGWRKLMDDDTPFD